MRISVLTLAVAIALGGVVPPASAGVEITFLNFNPNGRDTGRNSHLNRERVTIENTGRRSVSIDEWTIRDRGGDHSFRLQGSLGRGDYITVLTGRGEDSFGSGCNGHCVSFRILHWGLDDYVWNNVGDAVLLRTSSGRIADRCRYRRSDTSPTEC